VSRRSLAIACAVGVTVFALAALLPNTVGKANEMDEGAVNAYAARVLDGAVPHRDFLTFYGPGNPWLIAGAFAVFGESVGVERGVGLLYRLLIVASLFVVGWRLAGMVGGVAAALVATTILLDDTVWAYATYGALGFGLLGLALLATCATSSPSKRTSIGLVAAGLASGVAILIRFDFGLAVIASSVPLLALASWPARRRCGVGFLATACVYVMHLAVVGPDRIRRVTEDILAAGSGRYLQRETIWDYPGNLLAIANLATGALVLAGAYLVWRRRSELAPRIVLSAGLFSIGVLPLTISRMDPVHIRPYALVPLSLIPALALVLLETHVARRWAHIVGALAVSTAVLWGVEHYGRYDLDHFRSIRDVRSGYRGFYDDDSAAARTMVERLRRVSRPGESLFVGPQDLRRTNYGPTYMYFLLRDLRPASYYMEMNPGTANREGSGLADELRRADWLILTSEWDDWDEPNDSQDYGSPEPNRVVRELFCVRLEEGQYRLYERCDRAA
jgi:hypothetical protein